MVVIFFIRARPVAVAGRLAAVGNSVGECGLAKDADVDELAVGEMEALREPPVSDADEGLAEDGAVPAPKKSQDEPTCKHTHTYTCMHTYT